MNTPQLCDRIYFHLDRQRSNRYKRFTLVDGLNVAVDAFIKGRYDNIKLIVPYSFERVERVREELATLVTGPTFIAPAGANILVPGDFQYEILMYATINGIRTLSQTKTYSESDLSDNAFTEPSDSYPIHRRTSTGYNFEWGGGTFTQAELWYLKQQRILVFEDAKISAGAVVLINGQSYYVNNLTITQNGTPYFAGQTFVAVGTAFVGPGTVSLYVDTDMPLTSQEEIAKKAADTIAGISENYRKAQLLSGKVAEN
jgi:hypothetical protein